MKAIKLVFAFGVAFAAPVFAASPQGSAVAAATAVTEGEVRKVNKDSKKITLKHEAIRNLDMPPMTMVFVVKDEAMLDRVKQGDKVRFTAEKVGGALTLTSIEPAK
jgi:Cu(I)/Ag(I) efflux system protein CusF